MTLAKQLIDEGHIGKLYHYRGAYLQDWIVDPSFPRVWRLEKSKAGSGALGDIASHSVDLSRYLVGEIAEVAGLMETFIKRDHCPTPQRWRP
ncbi:MAG: Gfo/Idh/MocA family oxidoreductase [Pyrinomonadaceae bacterium]